MTPGNKVAALGAHFRLTQEGWAEVLGINRNTLASYKNRRNANPSTAKVREWGGRFGVPFAWFFDEEDSEPPVPRDHVAAERDARTRALLGEAVDPGPPPGSLPVAGAQDRDEDGTFRIVPPELLTYEEEAFASGDYVELPMWQGIVAGMDECHFVEEKNPRKVRVPALFVGRKSPDRFIVCLPKGFSMSPRIVQGDRVISLLDVDPAPNTIVVARRDDGVNFMKVLRLVDGRPELHSIHEDFPAIVDLGGWVLRGAVVGIWKPYLTDGPNIEFNGGTPLRG